MFKNLNRGISTPIAIGIIAVLVVVAGGGILAYQRYYIPQQTPENQQAQNQNVNQPPQLNQFDFSKLDKDALLHKLFPNLFFENGVADLASSGVAPYSDYPGLKLYLKDSVEGYFVNNQENLLLVVQLDGVAHAGGLYHAYLGLFDKNGNLLTQSSTFPKPINNTIATYEFDLDKTQFGGDAGQFGFYDCKGTKYILFAYSGCPNGSCCSAAAKLFRISNGNFENVQTINDQSLSKIENKPLSIILPIANAAYGPSYGLKMVISGDKILVKKVPATSDNGCPETTYKELNWNKNSCRFE